MEKKDCDCGIEFENKKSRRIHMQVFHSHLERIKCDFCDLVAPKKQMERHIDFSHKIKNIVCDTCGTVCKKEADLVAHIRIHHKVFTCHKCKQSFLGITSFKNHETKEHGKIFAKKKKIPGQCEQCALVFKDQSSLKYHVLNIHTPNDERPHKCDRCGKGYGTPGHLVRHVKTCKQ